MEINQLISIILICSQDQNWCLLSTFANWSKNKKSELMLMRRARAYSSSCSQVILVYLHPFCRNSVFSSQKSPKNH